MAADRPAFDIGEFDVRPGCNRRGDRNGIGAARNHYREIGSEPRDSSDRDCAPLEFFECGRMQGCEEASQGDIGKFRAQHLPRLTVGCGVLCFGSLGKR